MDPQDQQALAQEQMLQQQLLQQLRDIHAPDAIGWWPLAPGWWVLAALAVAAIAWVAIACYSRHKRAAYRREALRLCDQAYVEFEDKQNVAAYLRDINQLLRRVALQTGPSESMAKLSGSEWIDYLNKQTATAFSEDTSAALSELLYHPNPEVNASAVHTEVRRWIESHRVQKSVSGHA